MKTTYMALAVAAAGCTITPAYAQEQAGAPTVGVDQTTAAPTPATEDNDAQPRGGAHGFFAIGPGFVPAFDGAKKYQLIPLMISNVEWKGMRLEVRGLGARIDVLGDSRIQLGPVFNFRGSRDSKDASGRVKLLNEVDSAMEVGGYAGYRFGGNQYGQGEIAFDLTVTKDVGGGHEGVLGTAQVSYAAVRSQKVFFNIDAQTTYGDKKYMRTYFGVTPDEAVRSGLAAYRPDAGLRDIGAGMTLGYQFSERWGVMARAGANYYVGDVKDSPVVDEGSKLQAVGGLALSYRF